MTDAFSALSDPNRRRLLELLADGEQTAGTLVATLRAERPLSQPAVSQHLKHLRDAGLVRVRQDGRRRVYALNPNGMEVAHTWLDRLLERPGTFRQPLDALATEVARGKRSRATSTSKPDRNPHRTPDANPAAPQTQTPQ